MHVKLKDPVVHMCVCVCVCVCMYVCMYVCVCVYIYIYMCVCVCVCLVQWILETPSMYLKCLSLQNVEVMACMQKKNDVHLKQKVQKLRWLA